MKTNQKKSSKKLAGVDNFGFSPQITLLNNTEAVVDGCTEIKEYEDGKITFNIGKLNISFCGNNLVVKSFGDGLAEITGEFSEISFS